MATTYKKIASVTVGSGGAANIEFTSIPGTFDDLLIKVSGRSSGSAGGTTFDGIRIRPNGSTANLTSRILYGISGTGTGSNTDVNVSGGETSSVNATASTFGNSEIYISNYSTSNNKSISADGVSETNATAAAQVLAASLWSNSAAITSITLVLESASNFVEHSTAVLYGIKKS